MEMMVPDELRTQPIRPLKRVEYERLASEGYFDDEHVELLFGVVVEMTPISPGHSASTYHVRTGLERAIGKRAIVRENHPFAASEISEPQPDVMVVPAMSWKEHPSRAFLVVEVALSSIAKDQGLKVKLYGLAEVDEYWIVNLVDEVVEVYRDPKKGKWRSVTTYKRGEQIIPVAFPDVAVAVSEMLPPAEPA